MTRRIALLLATSFVATFAVLFLGNTASAFACTPGSVATGPGGLTITCPGGSGSGGGSSGGGTDNGGGHTHAPKPAPVHTQAPEPVHHNPVYHAPKPVYHAPKPVQHTYVPPAPKHTVTPVVHHKAKPEPVKKAKPAPKKSTPAPSATPTPTVSASPVPTPSATPTIPVQVQNAAHASSGNGGNTAGLVAAILGALVLLGGVVAVLFFRKRKGA